jgi:proline iminopeptidase
MLEGEQDSGGIRMSAAAALLGVLIQASPSPAATPPAPPPAPVVEGSFPGSGGTRLFHRKVGTGPAAVVFLHGGPGSNFRGSGDFIEPLATRGRMVVLYDQRGSGLSDLETIPALLTADHHVRDLEALRQHLGVRRMTLVGLSWGSGLAALYAARYPARVERLVLVSPMAPAKKPFWNERLAKLQALRGEAASARRAEMLARVPGASDEETRTLCRELSDDNFRLYFHEPTPEKLAHAARRCDIPPAAIRNRPVVEAGTLGSLGDWDFRPLLEGISAPTLVIEGEESNVPLGATREWAVLMPNARLLLIPDAGHEVFVDQPAAFTAALEQFLRGRFPRGAEVLPGPDAH